MRAADSATKRREVADFDRPAPSRGRHIAPGQAHRPLEFARGDGDQHLVHRPFAEPILPDRALPTRQDAFLAVEAANARTLDIDLAAVKADLALRPPPSMRQPAFVPRMAQAANRLCVLLHHFAQRLDPRRKAKSLEARRHAGKRLALQCMRRNRCGCDSLSHGVAFLLVESAPRAYRLKASNAAPLPFSTSDGTSPCALPTKGGSGLTACGPARRERPKVLRHSAAQRRVAFQPQVNHYSFGRGYSRMETALDANSTPTLKDLAIGVPAVGEREEFDSMGKVMVPADRYWGAQTQRSLHHFSIGDDRMPKAVYHAYGYVKKACALVNGERRRDCPNGRPTPSFGRPTRPSPEIWTTISRSMSGRPGRAPSPT